MESQRRGGSRNEKGELEVLITRLIAEQEGIPEEKVTVEYIREQREKRFYPNTRYNIGSDYGGYDAVGLKFSTIQELLDLESRADKFLNCP